MPAHQPDLFGDPAPAQPDGPRERPPMPEEFVARIRSELQETLQLVRESERFPWADLTKMTLAEMRFHSIATWLPEEECRELREAFEVEMTRLYEAHDAAMEAAGLIPPEGEEDAPER